MLASATSSALTLGLEIVALSAGLLAVTALVAGALILVRETRVAVDVMRERATHIEARIRGSMPLQP